MSKQLLLQLLFVLLATVAGRQLMLRPLSGAETRALLDRQELAEGRSVRSGLAALGGYTLGLSKALLGVFIYDVITANVSSIESETSNGYAQQVCFNTNGLLTTTEGRSNNIIDEDDDDKSVYNPYEDDDIYDNLGRQSTTTDTDSDTTSTDSGDTATTSSDADSNVATCIILYRNR
ncbi:uncharacterized protein LOC132791497 isoform X2 [Drosophila nasuta]|uniref:uncharacterized protein LOC132791497 isoform X2 n=1 Tax=Drosophila nasuta TaxID=42062 RepID=UPI00295EBD86|nr:uncharacterized protein LOC132791497 isoform X2 [Drosophila nasuta]